MSTPTTNLGLTKPAVNDPLDADTWGTAWNNNADTIDGEFATKTINQNFADKTLSRPLFQDYGEVSVALGNVTGSVDLDMTRGNHFSCTLTGNVTFTFTNPAPTGNLCVLTVEITQDATGSRTVTWPTVSWPAAVTPTVTSTASKTDIYIFTTRNAGTTWIGTVRGQNYTL